MPNFEVLFRNKKPDYESQVCRLLQSHMLSELQWFFMKVQYHEEEAYETPTRRPNTKEECQTPTPKIEYRRSIQDTDPKAEYERRIRNAGPKVEYERRIRKADPKVEYRRSIRKPVVLLVQVPMLSEL
ncbi:hypothetical protein EJ06DRAFT_524492 [Trichodelitschia bisporula]|uniref:Uncharacterized protein n=1 Tax=Trichodelitschia bisporula TaxID=703511 RepID=A0A6G1HKY1_9PEZI|nr:hypothetical protein EJ06DRAFT_524492 [Trichodelitschia bisporula]